MSNKTKIFFGFWTIDENCDYGLPLLEHVIDDNWIPYDKTILLNYLNKSPIVVAGSFPEIKCELCDEKVRTSVYSSDGVWLWPTDLVHYVSEHAVKLPIDFIEHIRQMEYLPPKTLEIDLEHLPWPEKLK